MADNHLPVSGATMILLVSGSSREGSANTAVLRTAAALARPGVETALYSGIGGLPLFNPDNDREGAPVDSHVAAMRAEMARGPTRC